MVEGFTSYSVDNDRLFRKALDDAGAKVKDLTIPLTLISRDFFKSQKAIWMLSGPGQYPDLAESTKIWKRKNGMSVYPILRRTGALESSMTNPTDSNAINEIRNKRELLVGTKLKYGVYHQSDNPRHKIPLRKFLFIGPEARRFATSEQMGRLQRWTSILDAYVRVTCRGFATDG